MSEIKVIAFDLDDTLLDTSRFLVARAAREACAAMVADGLNTDLQTCYDERTVFLHHSPRGDVYAYLARKFGAAPGASTSEHSLAAKGYNAFYNREVEADIELMTGARELLQDLQSRYALYLVTAGNVQTQMRKVEILKIRDFFEGAFYIDPSKNERKGDAFAAIEQLSKVAPQASLSVGNRLDTDLAPAKILGWRTCWLKYGEYAHMAPAAEIEIPDVTVTSLQELKSQCQI